LSYTYFFTHHFCHSSLSCGLSLIGALNNNNKKKIVLFLIFKENNWITIENALSLRFSPYILPAVL
jgi:hypothetical protein